MQTLPVPVAAGSAGSQTSRPEPCDAGAALLYRYREAVASRAQAFDLFLLDPESFQVDEGLVHAKEEYFRALVVWVTHKSACPSCQSISLAEDRIEFASV